MKKFLLLLIVASITIIAHAQTQTNPIGITAGGGFENYNGDLGKTFYNFHEEMYGFVRLGISHYLNSSFDAQLYGTYGDFGHCRDEGDDPTNLNMLGRMTTVNVALKYKFANGYLLCESTRLAPYLFAGAGYINMSDVWPGEVRINLGSYFSINGGGGLMYNFTNRLNLSYTLGFGYFTSDNVDNYVHGKNDLYMQNTFCLGMNF